VSTPAVRLTQPPIQRVPGVKCGRSVTLATHTRLVLKSRMSRSYTFSSPGVPENVRSSLTLLLRNYMSSQIVTFSVGFKINSTVTSSKLQNLPNRNVACAHLVLVLCGIVLKCCLFFTILSLEFIFKLKIYDHSIVHQQCCT
jgi:hypothetical protein